MFTLKGCVVAGIFGVGWSVMREGEGGGNTECSRNGVTTVINGKVSDECWKVVSCEGTDVEGVSLECIGPGVT